MIDIDAALAALSLDEKCRLVAGETNWRTPAIAHAGIPQLKMTDGPTGVRGEGHGSDGTPGVAVPAAITLGATWDTDLVAEIGSLLGTEARRKHAHVLLGPTVNLHRTPLGGRTFECYSEDPELTGALAARYVAAVQAHEVAVTVKHFVCNDTEVERLTVDVDVDERTLRELYLRPFERAVRDGGAWGVMTAYNRLGGDHCAENRRLLTDVLRAGWGFDGFVVSDWFGVHEPVGAANAGLSLEMPGPARAYGARLRAAVDDGRVSEATVDGLVRDLVTVMNRTRADERSCDEPEESVDDPVERALTRRAAIAGTVLLRNRHVDTLGGPVLPLPPGRLGSVAVLGPNAVIDRSMGGGSASLTPFGHRTLLDALTARLRTLDPSASVTYEPGVRIDRLTPLVRRAQLRTSSDEPGLTLEYVDGTDWDADAVQTTTTPTSMVRFFGTTIDGVDPTSFGARITGSYIPDADGPHTIGIVATGPVTMTATPSGRAPITVVDDPEMLIPRTREFFGYGSAETTTVIDARAGEPIELAVKWLTGSRDGFAAVRVGVRPPDPADLLERAVAAAADADTAVVMVGTNDEWETEGWDRETMDLPGRQDDLVEGVLAANPNTVVIVNAGSPVTMDWADDDRAGSAPAVVTSFFAGQEQAEGLVDVLLGESDPGGRLPTTYPKRLADTPAFLSHEPDHDSEGRSTQRYAEGLFIGHRWYEARDVAPRFWFGHGLSYGSADWGDPAASATTVDRTGLDDDPIVVQVPVAVTGDRDATVVVQGYVAPVDPSCIRPVKELKTWAKAVIGAGSSATLELVFGRDAFQRWDTATGSWVVDPGEYDLVLAASAAPAAEHARLRVTITT